MTGQIITSVATAHEGYLLCNGSMVSKELYGKLFALIGDTYGESNSTHFYLPDFRNRTGVGATSVTPVGAIGDGLITMSNLPVYNDAGTEAEPSVTFAADGGGSSNIYSPESPSAQTAYYPPHIRLNYFIKY